MIKSKLILMAVVALAMQTFPSHAQIQATNFIVPPSTLLENVETTPGQVVIKATAPAGSVQCSSALVTVTCKEDTLVSNGQKMHGLSVDIALNGQPDDKTIVDYDELDALVNALSYMNNVTWSITSLSSFDVVYTTKAGLRVSVFSSKRSGQVEFSIRSNRMTRSLVMTPDQRAQFVALINQAKGTLTTLRNS